MFKGLFVGLIGLAVAFIIYAFLSIVDIIMEFVIQKIEKLTGKQMKDYFLPWDEDC